MTLNDSAAITITTNDIWLNEPINEGACCMISGVLCSSMQQQRSDRIFDRWMQVCYSFQKLITIYRPLKRWQWLRRISRRSLWFLTLPLSAAIKWTKLTMMKRKKANHLFLEWLGGVVMKWVMQRYQIVSSLFASITLTTNKILNRNWLYFLRKKEVFIFEEENRCLVNHRSN